MAREVEEFNNVTCCFTGEALPPVDAAQRLRGEKQPSYVYHEWVLHALRYGLQLRLMVRYI